MGKMTDQGKAGLVAKFRPSGYKGSVAPKPDLKEYEPTGDVTEDGKKIMRKKTSSPTLAQSVDRRVLSQSTGRSSTLLGG